MVERKLKQQQQEKVFFKNWIKIFSNKIFILETPPRSPSVASSDSGNSSDEEKAIREDYVHPTSLKAWKQKKDKETQEQEQQIKAKRPQSGNRSDKVKSPRAAAEKASKPTTAREKSPKGNKIKRPTSATPSEKLAQEPSEPSERVILKFFYLINFFFSSCYN